MSSSDTLIRSENVAVTVTMALMIMSLWCDNVIVQLLTSSRAATTDSRESLRDLRVINNLLLVFGLQ